MPNADKNLKAVADRLPDIIKDGVQEMELVISGLIATQMGERALSDAYRSGASDNAFDNSTRRNTGEKLRIASGRLVQSFTRNKPDNENQLVVTDSRVTLRIASTVPYAAIHEFGGTINHPGGTAYFVRDGRAVFVSKAKDDGSYRKTKPHAIPMPARPYLAPAIAKFDAEYLPKILDEMAVKIGKVMEGGYNA